MVLIPEEDGGWCPTREFPVSTLWVAARAMDAGTRLRVVSGCTVTRTTDLDPSSSIVGETEIREGDILTLCSLDEVGGRVYVRAWLDRGGTVPPWISYGHATSIRVMLADAHA